MEDVSYPAEGRKAKKIIAVMSGKGGVGKSTLTGLMASGFQRLGFQSGVLDGDLISPNMVNIFGATMQFSLDENGAVEPLKSRKGVKVMSMTLFQENTHDPLIWRGPMISSAFKQFYSEIGWGQLDYLFIDVPTGTSDVPMTVLQALPLDGIIVVSSPQRLALSVTERCIKMINQLHGHIFGVVENMGIFLSSTGEHYELFGSDSTHSLADIAQAPLLAQIPFDPRLTALCDAGRIEEYRTDAIDILLTRVSIALDRDHQ